MSRRGRWIAPLLVLACESALGGGGPLGIDHEWSYDQSGIWEPRYRTDLEYGVIFLEAGGALWLGNDSAVGHTLWQCIDSSAITAISASGLKAVVSRKRPDQGDNPDEWFQGHGYESFPSGEVALQASFVTPIIADYAKSNPWLWSLELMPLYDAIGRLKAQAHWQSDVLAGWALGSGIGYWSATLKTPISVQILPRGLSVGISKRF